MCNLEPNINYSTIDKIICIDILSNPDPYWCIGKSVSLNWVNVFLRLGQCIGRLLFQNMFIYLCKLNIYKLKGSMSFLNVYHKL